ncbi:D-beta-hydroxybutyrate dehydrogenase [Zhongshania aliphaticivorans]|uniref:D-beta-hydroxybutyrate dehydrogenase n=1 Tax=Zhongshania aliphaticivorans TaxID=1470434 RepID=A0A5S9N3E6_9GAMM|nr:3-hydroxybutyrate dehydrogenase [Zhongshania aliphaticivorans]CAA0082716.1 D-beta-hydroxybutyrate dehydrogenase [Zhongshania aliphaticivorans]CAA0084002.1 D-beta-hydroxybutyrate dehydrogenase [Zhongshania aliphaticivorans]
MRSKTALVTGAASGIGLAIGNDLCRQGFTVWYSDISLQDAESAASVSIAKGFNAHAIKLDVTSESDINYVVEQLVEHGGYLDILINNAGIQHVARLEDFPVDRWKLITEILLIGPAMLCRALLPLMRQQNFGRIINVGSIHSLIASPHKSAYVAAKHGLLGFSKVVALETSDQNITINTLCPSYVKTPLVEQQIASQAKVHGISEEDVINKIMLEPMPKKSFIDMDELSAAVNYLVSDAARNMTGQELVIDGGWTIK